MRAFFAIAFFGVATATAGAVPVTPAAQEVNARATEAARVAFSSPEAFRSGAIAATVIAIGPRLWEASQQARKPFKDDTKDTYGVVPSPRIVVKWKLSPLDLSLVPDAARPVLAEAARAGTPVRLGAITSRADVVLPALMIAQLKDAQFPFSVRRPTEAELEYYYSLIPYELSEPILVVESGAHVFLCHFDEAGKVFFVEML